MSKEAHGFNPDVATAIGVNCAIVLQHLIFLHKSSLDNPHVWDEETKRYWIRKTAAAFAKTYPYFTPKEIRGALEKMERLELIIGQTGLANTPFDRTKGYSIQPAGFDLMETAADQRQVFKSPFYKRANASDKRANQKLPKGQMNKDCISLSDSELKDNSEGEKPIDPLKPKFKYDMPEKYLRFNDPPAIAALWKRWVDYRKARKKPIPTEDSAYTALKLLYTWTKGDVAACTLIVEKSIAGGWQSLVQPEQPKQPALFQQPTPYKLEPAPERKPVAAYTP